ncbi:PP2C family protein-serine/threonine phosphatase [Patescibacteria group bacterium]|nr:PP2C family protein-serine/threonine phosphatase [Patescibacteria group bacterium]MBU1702918.1 PP2C family protein-serine/threonine phosphatase [Patescibacteria group bacterium]MBU1953492.1 PP2C family protein-serine/threonine phosphatase [Patescibacteria group bacterium]
MLPFVKSSVVKRAFVYFAVFTLVVVLSAYLMISVDQRVMPTEYFFGTLLFFVICFIAVFYFEVGRPLKIILIQMKALLTGKRYKRIYTNRMDEIGIIAHFFNEVTKSFEKVSMDIKEGKRMLSELEIASQIQKDILPPECPKVPGLTIVAKNRPAVELGGDSFDFITKGDNTFIYVGDVTGHGVPAAIVMTMVNTLIHTFVDVYDNSYDVLVNTNKQLKTRIKSTMFMTLLMLRWNSLSKKMTYVGAGHEHLLIYRAKAGKCEMRQSGGIALGMVPDNSKLIKEMDIDLDEGDVVVLYTDGVTEGRNMAGELYGIDRLKESVEQFANEYGPEGIVNHVAQNYSNFVENHIQDDDVTLIAVQIMGENLKGELGSSSLLSTAWSGESTAKK